MEKGSADIPCVQLFSTTDEDTAESADKVSQNLLIDPGTSSGERALLKRLRMRISVSLYIATEKKREKTLVRYFPLETEFLLTWQVADSTAPAPVQ